jgi:glyoxylase-like metal-dependent hydrolase (beta-lactamase superfamily II)
MNHFKLGKFEVSRIEEIVDRDVDAKVLLPDITFEMLDANADWLAPSHYNAETRRLVLVFQSWLIRTGRYTILVDTCNGNDKSRPYFPIVDHLNTPYLDRLKAAGCAPEDVDFVLCTHLHIDHVGWNTRLENGRWVPTFPNAKYLIGKKECDPFAPGKRAGSEPPPFLDIYEDSVLPVIEAGQAELVEGCRTIIDSLMLEPAPGHTAGHSIVRAGEKGEMALFIGDAIHNPIQIVHPEINSGFCTDPAAARKTRRRILDECAEDGHLLVPAHFGPPYLGRVRRRGETYCFQPGL